MDEQTRRRFAELWNQTPRVPLAQIAKELGYSWHSLAKWRLILRLRKRYGAQQDDGETPTRAVIRIRCQQQQTNWTETERQLRWQGTPHTIYASITSYDEPT